MDKLHRYTALDKYLQAAGASTASAVYASAKTDLSRRFGELEQQAQAAKRRHDVAAVSSLHKFFRSSSKFARHFDFQFGAASEALGIALDHLAESVPARISEDLDKNDFASVQGKLDGLLRDSSCAAVDDIFKECDGRISAHFKKISEKVQREAAESPEVAVATLKELLPVAVEAMKLSSVAAIRFKPVALLTLVFKTCEAIFETLRGSVEAFLESRFQFEAAEKEFKVLARFRVFDGHFRACKDFLPADSLLFEERIIALKRERIDRLGDALNSQLRVAVGLDLSPANPAHLDELTVKILLRGVAKVERVSIFPDSVDFFDVKKNLSKSIVLALEAVVDQVNSAIKGSLKGADASKCAEMGVFAGALLEKGKYILGIASEYKFVEEAYASDRRREMEKQRKVVAARPQYHLVNSTFFFDTAHMEDAHRYLQMAKEDDYEAYISFKGTAKVYFLDAKAQVSRHFFNRSTHSFLARRRRARLRTLMSRGPPGRTSRSPSSRSPRLRTTI
jgi:hypothetical protein